MGKPGKKPVPVEEKIDRNGPISDLVGSRCWVWLGFIHPTGYGVTSVNRRSRRAHRVVFEMYKGKIPDGLHLDHLCLNKACVNPAHLEAVTQRENSRRASEHGLFANQKKTHCRNGHLLTPDNLYPAPPSNPNKRRCAPCAREQALRSWHKKNGKGV